MKIKNKRFLNGDEQSIITANANGFTRVFPVISV